MKRWIRLFTPLLVVCLLICTLPVTASAKSMTYRDEYGTWTYEVDADGGVTILKCKTAQKNIVIPATIDGMPVKTLGKHLFQNNDTITAVVIPHGVETIEKMVFFGCNKLEDVEIPTSVTAVGDKAFSKCGTLETLYIPASVTELGDKVFDDSPNLDVHCPLNSETAAYLEENKSEVANYTLIQVTPQNPVPQPQPGVVPDSPTTTGKLVTYSFGKTVNGKPEFTFVVADSNPDLDLMHYLVRQENGNTYLYQSETVRELMGNRFQLVSMSRYDGKENQTFDFTKYNTGLHVSTYVYNYLDEAGKPQSDVLYQFGISVMNGDYVSGFPCSMEFNSDNEMLNFVTINQDADTSMVKEGDRYTHYEKQGGTSTRYDANTGGVIMETNDKAAYIHNFGVQGSCVSITIRQTDFRQPNGFGFSSENREIVTYAPDTKTTVDAVVNESFRLDGTKERQQSTYIQVVDGVVKDDRIANMVYDGKGNLVVAHKEVRSPGSETGTYEVTQTVGKKFEQQFVTREEQRTDGSGNRQQYHIEVQVQDTNRTYYQQTVVKAEGVQDAMDKASQNFPNDPNEHENDVSYRYVNTVDIHKETGTQTNVNTGTETSINRLGKTEELKDHTYIEDTGKYVGWDWTWNYDYASDEAAARGEGVLTHYMVTEYKYSSDGSWTKTEIHAYAKDHTNGSTIDFKDTGSADVPTMEQILADYNVSSETFIFDYENSGMDNWRKTDGDRLNGFTDGNGEENINHSHTDQKTGTTVNVVTVDGEKVGDAFVNGNPTEDSELKGDTKEQVEGMPERLEEISGILQGTSQVTVDGATVTQNTVKDEMMDFAEDLKEDALTEADFFTEAVQEADPTLGAGELVDAAEDLLEGGDLPQANAEGTVNHYHREDGSAVTEIVE